MLLSFAFVIKRLLDVIIRDHMRFLLPENQISQSEESSASQKNSLVQQQALLRKIPGDFQQAFLETLRAKCVVDMPDRIEMVHQWLMARCVVA